MNQPLSADRLQALRRINTLRKQANDHDNIPHTALNPRYSAKNPYVRPLREALRKLTETQTE